MSITYVGVTPSLAFCNPNASQTDERPVQLTWTDGHMTRTDGHNDNRGCKEGVDEDQRGTADPFEVRISTLLRSGQGRGEWVHWREEIR